MTQRSYQQQLSPLHVRDVARHFIDTSGEASIALYGSGRIHDTYEVKVESARGGHYLLQRINRTVFPEPEKLVENISSVTAHLQAKYSARGVESEGQTLQLVPARNGALCFVDADGEYWRMYNFVEHARSHDSVESPHQAYEVGRAYGEFQRFLLDFPPQSLHVTIPRFHDTPWRLEQLVRAVDADRANRAAAARQEIAFALSHENTAHALASASAAGSAAERVVHNDAKVSNVLFDDAGNKAMCVIDLDTVMPGLSLFDFGDCMRSVACRGGEETLDIVHATLDLALFDALTHGFLEEARSFLTWHEIDLLVTSGIVISFELGVRFLTDYLQADVYFKTNQPDQNLNRARGQFRVMQSIEKQRDLLEAVVARYK